MTETILVVDDHDTVRQALSRWLETVFHNCLILTAATGEEALAIARDTPPQVVVMDFGLPGMNGVEAARRIKAIAPAAQVVVLTIHNSAAYRMDAAEAGASAYILKEDMQTQLVPTLKTLLVGSE
ncbi:MAG: response regulator transcription factor [Anaerolineae bacterium]|nr:response regulator transcription factor [Anaerolineae bacterium]